jgi:hypothetical protein
MHEQVGRISRRRGFGLLLSFYRNICVVVFTVAEWVGSPVTLQARVTNALFTRYRQRPRSPGWEDKKNNAKIERQQKVSGYVIGIATDRQVLCHRLQI